MPTIKSLPVKKLDLDLHNFRTVTQRTELAAVQGMIAVSPDWFWALMDSLVDSGYLQIENIIILKGKRSEPLYTVKEGNRRVAILKLALGILPIGKLEVPDHISKKVEALTPEWKKVNSEVPCSIFPPNEEHLVDRLVTLAHGKGEKAGRDPWEAVARARHNRNRNGSSEPGLDLLESYLRNGQNLTEQQKKRWAGKYPLSVLDEAIKKLAGPLGATSARDLVKLYPNKLQYLVEFEQIMLEIGLGSLGFEKIRHKTDDFAAKYGIPGSTSGTSSNATGSAGQGATGSTSANATSAGSSTGNSASTGGNTQSSAGSTSAGKGKKTKPTGSQSFSIRDPRAVYKALNEFSPHGNHREKVITLLKEAREMKLHKQPHAFCFLLRSMFELSAKAYCNDHTSAGGPACVKSDGKDRQLVDILRDVVEHMVAADPKKQRLLHGVMTHLATPENLMSITSLNQLIHNPKFSVSEGDIASMFFNVFPLLSEMN